jgi:exodeoxyribonuclease VII small subunit
MAKTDPKKQHKDLRFEEAVEQLENILQQIEAGNLGLEESLSGYERGMTLIGHCRTLLAKTEKRIAELTADNQGRLVVRDNDPPDTPPRKGASASAASRHQPTQIESSDEE